MGGLTVYIIEFIDECTRSGMLLGIYMAILVFFAFSVREKNRVFVESLVFPGIVMLFGVFFAIPVVDLFIKDFVGFDTAPRYTWIMIPTFVMALAFAYFIRSVDGNIRKIFACIALCILVFLCGEHKITGYVYSKPENLYKFPQSVIDITDKVTSDMDQPKICVPASSSYPFRQISTKIQLMYGENATIDRIMGTGGIIREVAYQMERSQPDLYFITDICRQYDVDYIVLDKSYMVFGETDLNYEGYEPNHIYIGDRTPIETESDGVDHSKELNSIKVKTQSGEDYWDFSDLELTYVGTYGQYLLYELGR